MGLHLRRRRLQPRSPAQPPGGSVPMRAPMNCQLIGRWRIVEADLWDGDYLDLVEPATMTIRADGRRNRVRRRAGRPRSVVSRLFRTLVGGVLRLSDQGVT